jgi:hypothetical protein
MHYMTQIQNMSFFLLKVNNPSVRHLVWPVGHPAWPPRLAPVGHPVRPRLALRLATPFGHPSGTPSIPVWPPVWPPCLATPVWHPRLATPFGHPSGTPSGPVGHPVWPPSGTPSGRRRLEKIKNKNKILFFGCCCRLEKRAKNISVFGFQSPRSPSSPSQRVPRALRASRAKPREEEGFFGLVPLVTHPSSIPLLGGLTPKFLSLSFHSL